MLVCLVPIFIACINVCAAQTGTDAKDLRTQLFVTDGYDKKVLPLIDQSRTVDVYVSLYLLTINSLDEVTETLKTTCYLWISWYDDYLVWLPSDYGGISYYNWPQDDVWKPDVTLKNSVLQYKELGGSGLNVKVDYDGYVYWYPFQVFESTCSVDITYFPFDIQECDLVFVAWSYSISDVYLRSGSSGIRLDGFESNSVWEVIDSSISSESSTSDSQIKFTLKIKRKPLYFLLSVIMPIIMLSVLNVFVFTLPCESGERAGYAITVFLALAVFLTIISTELPANSESVAIFSIYVIIQTLQSTLTALLSLLTIRFSTRQTKVPSYLVKLYHVQNLILCRRRKIVPGDKPCDQNTTVSVISDFGRLEKDDNDYQEMENKDDAFEREDTCDPEVMITWSQAVRAIDLFLFVMFFLILAVSTIVCFSMIASHS